MGLIQVYKSVFFPEEHWTLGNQLLFSKDFTNFLIHLHQKFNQRRLALLNQRIERQREFDHGGLPQFLDSKTEASSGKWKVAPLPKALLRRRVEITGPVNSSKMVINMLNPNDEGCSADTAMLDFEDSMKPTFSNVLEGYKNVIGAVKGDLISFDDDKKYMIDPQAKTYVMVRVRGLHLFEKNIQVGGEEISAGLLDLAICFFHTSRDYLKRGLNPKYYIPKCEHYLEARWWNDVFKELESFLDLPLSTLRATFLIETLPASYQVEEILYEIRDHAAGLNVGRWDKIFSDIKTLRYHPERIMPDRSSITMSKPWMENYAKRIIQICHDRGALAIGGMSAYTPGKTEEVRREQTAKVLEDKLKEASLGHDGCWVSHPYFIGVALKAMNFDNQLSKTTNYNKYSDILPRSDGPHSLQGLKTNIRVGIAYMHGLSKGLGCIAFDNLMEDLATLEISRAQTWQWYHHKINLDEGISVTKSLLRNLFDEECGKILSQYQSSGYKDFKKLESELQRARDEAFQIYTEDNLKDFLTLSSYPA